jgi:hypothetical protein
MKKQRYYFYDRNQNEILNKKGRHLYVVAKTSEEAYEKAADKPEWKGDGLTRIGTKPSLTQYERNVRHLEKRKKEKGIVNRTVTMHEDDEEDIKYYAELGMIEKGVKV